MKAILTEKLPVAIDEIDADIVDDGESGVFGNVFLPESWLSQGDFLPYEFYLGRISASDFNCETKRKCKKLCEDNAYLYFFAEAKNFKFSSLKARVRLFCGETDACTEFNDEFFEEDEIAYKLSPSAIDDGDASVFEESADEVILLSVPADVLPFEIKGEFIEFYMQKSDFINGLFEQCKIRTV